VLNYVNEMKLKMVNVIGLNGLGKTRFLSEVANYLSERSKFQDGIFMFDAKRIKTVD
jgi:signal recognition particle GTPase